MVQGHPALLVFNVDQNAVALVEGAALAILSAQANRRALQQQRSKSDRLSHAVVEWVLAAAHRSALFQQLLDLGVNMKSVRITCQPSADFLDAFAR